MRTDTNTIEIPGPMSLLKVYEDARALADETRRLAFVIYDRRDRRFAVDDGLTEDEFTSFMHQMTSPVHVVQVRPTIGLNERFCESCGQIVHRGTLGGRTVEEVLYRSSDGLHWHSSRWSTHTPENCLAWTRFFVLNHRAAQIGYEGIV